MIGALAVKATVALIAALLIVASLRRARASMRHLVLAATFAFVLLLPAVQRFVPRWAIEVAETTSAPVAVLVERSPYELSAGQEPAAPRSSRVDWVRVYGAGVVAMLAWLAIGVWRLRRLERDGEVWLEGTARLNEIALDADIRRSALVMVSSDVSSPMTFGFRKSTVMLPMAAREWADDELARALRHELEHVRRDDWMLQLIARAAVAVYWLHPLAWIAWRRFILEAERACDDAVVGSCDTPDVYAGQLVALARGSRMHAIPALGMASRSRLAQRIDAILDATQQRGPHSRAAAIATLIVAFMFMVSIAPVQLVAAAAKRVIAPMTSAIEEDNPYDSAVNEALIAAAEAGDVLEVTRLLDSGVDVNAVSLGDGTALIGAARGGQSHMIEFLLERGADVNLEVRGDGSPLIAAAHAGYVDIVRELLARGANIDAVVPDDENALIQAASEGHSDVVRFLIDHGADVNMQCIANGNEIRTPLRMARRGGFSEIEEMLVRAGARR